MASIMRGFDKFMKGVTIIMPVQQTFGNMKIWSQFGKNALSLAVYIIVLALFGPVGNSYLR